MPRHVNHPTLPIVPLKWSLSKYHAMYPGQYRLVAINSRARSWPKKENVTHMTYSFTDRSLALSLRGVNPSIQIKHRHSELNTHIHYIFHFWLLFWSYFPSKSINQNNISPSRNTRNKLQYSEATMSNPWLAMGRRQSQYLLCIVLDLIPCPWWRHQMQTFSASLARCDGNHRSPVTPRFFLSAPEKMIEQTIENPVICDALALIMTSL